MAVNSLFKKIGGYLLLIALLVAFVVILNIVTANVTENIPDKDGSSVDDPSDEEGLKYYYDLNSTEFINFDFEEEASFFDDGTTSYTAEDGYLKYYVGDYVEGYLIPPVVFPLARNTKEIKITDYSEISFSFDIIYSFPHGSGKGDWECKIKNYGRYFLQFSKDDTTYPGDGLGIGVGAADLNDTGSYYMTYNGTIYDYYDGAEFRKLTVTFKLEVNKASPLDSIIYTYVDDEQVFTSEGKKLPSDTLYGLCIRYITLGSPDAYYDNFKCITKK